MLRRHRFIYRDRNTRIHNYRLAFDFFRNVPGNTPDGRSWAFADRTPEERKFWDTAGRIWVEMGGAWGGNWRTLIDRPHCEFTGGRSVSVLRAGQRLPDNSIMKWEEHFVDKINMVVNGKVVEVRRIFHEDQNFPHLRDLAEALGFSVDWTAEQGIVITSKKV